MRRPARGGRMGCRNVIYGSAARARAGVAPFLRLAPTARQCFVRARCANARFSAERPSTWLCDSFAAGIGRCGALYVKILALKKAVLSRVLRRPTSLSKCDPVSRASLRSKTNPQRAVEAIRASKPQLHAPRGRRGATTSLETTLGEQLRKRRVPFGSRDVGQLLKKVSHTRGDGVRGLRAGRSR